MTEQMHVASRWPQPEPVDHWDTGPGIVESVWRYRWLVIAVTLVAALAGFLLSFLQATMYEGEARLFLADPRNAGVFREETRIVIDPSRYVRNQSSFIESTPVFVRAAELTGSALTVDAMAERVTATPATDSDVITIRALDPTPEGSADLTNAIAEAYQQLVREEVQRNAEASLTELEASMATLRTEIDSLEAQLRSDSEDSALRAQRDAAVSQLINLEQRAEQIAVDAALYGSGVELFEEAQVPDDPVQPQPLRNAAIAAILGAMAASAYAWWRADQHQLAEHHHDPAPLLGAPLLGDVPVFEAVGGNGPIPALSSPGSTLAEAYQFIASSLQFALEAHGASSVLITSPGPGDGKTVTALNLAIAAAKDGSSVLLVDADERMRGLSHFGESNPEPGLTDLALEGVSVEEATRTWSLSENVKLPVIPAGKKLSDTAGFFRTPGFKVAMEKIGNSADLVLVDSPPLLAVADASAIASHVDGIVLVVPQGTHMEQLEEVAKHLAFLGTPLLGYVFNRVDPKRGGRYGRYGGYGSYGYGSAYGHTVDADSVPGDGAGSSAGRSRRQRREGSARHRG